MDIAAYVLAGLGGLLLAFAGAHGFESKSITIVSFGVGASLIIAGGCCYWQDAVWKADAKLIPPTDRPWLNVEVIPAGPITYHQEQADIAAFFPITFRVTNTGHSPSSEIQLKASVFFRRFGHDPKERQRQIASGKGHEFKPGVVFPGTPEEFKITYVKPISEMKECGIDPGAPTSEQVKHFDAYIGGCISYTYGGTQVFHGETGFLYEVNVHPADRPDTNIVPEIGKDIPLERVTFRRYFAGGGEWAK